MSLCASDHSCAVAAPLSWPEVEKSRSAPEFDPRAILKRIAASRSDPWRGLLRTRQSLTAAALRPVGAG